MKPVPQQVQETETPAAEALPNMDDDQFRQWTRLLEERTGMVLPPERKSFLVTSLGLRMREIGCSSYQEYFEKLTQGRGGLVEWSTLVDRLTVHETRFFRHPPSMDLIRAYALAKEPDAQGKRISIHAWSAGCSTGEEAYTLAMVIDRALREREVTGYFGVTGTDISQPALGFAREGLYPQRRTKDLPADFVEEYFTVSGAERFRVCDRLRKRTCFARMNILDTASERIGKMDIIYCQNLLIYFARSRREGIVNDMVEHLLPGGLLILGSGELVGWRHPNMQKVNSVHTLAYRRCSGA